MKHLTVLCGWLILLFALEISAVILDSSHYLIWGIGGLYFLKACYLGFASVLFFRFLSFRAQKSYEGMVESYSRISGKEIEVEKPRKYRWVNSWLYFCLVVLSSIDLAMNFHWTLLEFHISIIVDFLIWVLAIRYVSRAHWLKSMGRREKIKAFLDDSRSKMKREDSAQVDAKGESPSGKPFLWVATTACVVSLLISLFRWSGAEQTFKMNELKACMVKTMSSAAEQFYQNGKLQMDFTKEACGFEHGRYLDFNLFLAGGEIYLRGKEKAGIDFFGNSVLGDESLVLDPVGRFRKSVTPNKI